VCTKKFKKIKHITCKIIAFEVKKIEFFCITLQNRATNFESSWLETFVLHRVEVFDIMLEALVENPLRNINPKFLYLHYFIKVLSGRRYVMKRLIELLIMLMWD
jgi:hypothetical protein